VIQALKGKISAPQAWPSFCSEVSFKPVDFVTKQLLDDLFAFTDLQSSDGSALLIERNMVARDIFTPAGLGHVPPENAFTARMRTCRISKVQAGERVLERRGGFLRSAN
jgi:hypothetical protein